MKTALVSCLFVLLSSYVQADDRPIRVALLNPGGEHWFWQMTIEFMQAAAADLNIELEVLTSDRDHLLTIEQTRALVQRENPPDYILTGNEKRSAGRIIQLANEAKIRVFLFNNGFVDARDIDEYGTPRSKYPYWIGQLIPDNFVAGYQMGEALIQRGMQTDFLPQPRKLKLVAIAGEPATHASAERIRGLRAVVDEYQQQVQLLQIVPSDWTQQRGYDIAAGLLKRYQNFDLVWAANDSMAMGAMQAARASQLLPGKDLLFAGCGWFEPALDLIKSAELVTSVGGHFMDGAWSLVLVHDYHHGKDFITERLSGTMSVLDRSNVESYLNLVAQSGWHQIDFKRFSKVYQPNMARYDFALDSVLEQF